VSGSPSAETGLPGADIECIIEAGEGLVDVARDDLGPWTCSSAIGWLAAGRWNVANPTSEALGAKARLHVLEDEGHIRLVSTSEVEWRPPFDAFLSRGHIDAYMVDLPSQVDLDEFSEAER
jgi:hypothetical protein